MQVTNDEQSITSTRGSLDRQEADFLARVGPAGVFSLKQAQRILGEGWENYVRRYLARLKLKGWIERIKPGLYSVIPPSSGTDRTPQLHEYLVAMRLVEPAASAFFSAMNYHELTEQLPREVYVATDHGVTGARRASLGLAYRIISLSFYPHSQRRCSRRIKLGGAFPHPLDTRLAPRPYLPKSPIS
jgi:predicted transcriptional regulator of viral defense system